MGTIGQRRRSAAITGAGSGLGRDIALGLAVKGYRVFGTAFSIEEIADLKRASNDAATLTHCDITDENSVKKWAREISDALGNDGLDLLVSNAGILTPGPIEVLSLDDIRREFAVDDEAMSLVLGLLDQVYSLRRQMRRLCDALEQQPPEVRDAIRRALPKAGGDGP